MGQQANSGRNASLDDKKRRAAGRARSDSPEADAIKDAVGLSRQKGRAGGAFGKGGNANQRGTGGAGGGGGGGGADPKARDADVPRGSKRARRR